jgi:hypothetical protein
MLNPSPFDPKADKTPLHQHLQFSVEIDSNCTNSLNPVVSLVLRHFNRMPKNHIDHFSSMSMLNRNYQNPEVTETIELLKEVGSV